MTMKKSSLFSMMTIALALAAAASPSLLRSQTGEVLPEEEKVIAGWLTAGRTSFPFDVAGVTKTPAGIICGRYSPALELRAVVCDGDTVWIGTEGGLFAYSSVDDSLSLVEGPSFLSVNAIAVDRAGALWIGGDEGLCVRRDGRWSHYVSDRFSFFERITGFYPSDERMWISTYGQGCGYMTIDSLTVLSRADSLLDDRVLCVMEKEGEEVLFGTASGLCRADSFSWQSMRYGSRIPIGAIEDMIVDEEDNLFLAVAWQGVTRYNLGRVEVYVERDGLAGSRMRSFSIDPTGNVWVAGKSGISIYDGSGWTPLRMEGLSPGRYDILSICHDSSANCYAGTSEGKLLVISIDSIREIELPQMFPARTVPKIREYNGVLWMISGSGIFRLGEGLNELPLPDPWYEGALTGLVLDASGGAWVSTRFGILHFDGNKWEVFDRRLGLPTEYFTWASRGIGDELWFGTFDQGILRLTSGGWVHYTDENGLPHGEIIDLVTDTEGSSWVLSMSGRIARFASGKWEKVDLPLRGNLQPAQKADTLIDPDSGIRLLGGTGSAGDDQRSRHGFCMGRDYFGNSLVCRTDGIYFYSDGGWQVVELPFNARDIIPTAVAGSSRGEIWLGTADHGIYVRRGERWTRIGAVSGLSDDHIMTLCEDGEGRIWAGTRLGGLSVCVYSPKGK